MITLNDTKNSTLNISFFSTFISKTRSYENIKIPNFLTPSSSKQPVSEEIANTLNFYKLNDLYLTYDPEIGFRTAYVLGSMIIIIIFYLIWRHKISPSSKNDLNMDFWFNYIDRKKIERSDTFRNNILSEYMILPSETKNSRLSTATWILEHSHFIKELSKNESIATFSDEREMRDENIYVRNMIRKNKIKKFWNNKLNFKSIRKRKYSFQTNRSQKEHENFLEGNERSHSRTEMRMRNQSWPMCENNQFRKFYLRNDCFSKNRQKFTKSQFTKNDYLEGIVYRI